MGEGMKKGRERGRERRSERGVIVLHKGHLIPLSDDYLQIR